MAKTARQLDREIAAFVQRPWRGSRVQTLLFSRPLWSKSEAQAWAREHGYRHEDVDVKPAYFHLRQHDPKAGRAKRTIHFGRGIQAVIEET